jgi:hypothetical protein
MQTLIVIIWTFIIINPFFNINIQKCIKKREFFHNSITMRSTKNQRIEYLDTITNNGAKLI